MSEYLLRLEYIDDYASSFSNIHRDSTRRYQDVSTATAANLLAVRKIYSSQLDHCTLAFDSAATRMLALVFLSSYTSAYTVRVV